MRRSVCSWKATGNVVVYISHHPNSISGITLVVRFLFFFPPPRSNNKNKFVCYCIVLTLPEIKHTSVLSFIAQQEIMEFKS